LTRLRHPIYNLLPTEVEGFDSLTGPPRLSDAQDWLQAELEGGRVVPE